ncbi:MAG TPA: pitrilysin family protein [Acidobacteriota bacterium]|nr:pitrilysin family protein [Acidobacteriota bacterium]
MRKWIWILLIVFAASIGLTAGQQVEVQEATLSNGMKFLMVPRHEAPTVSAGWVARVGSVNERPGITGIAHLFEHMMFKGTRTIGINDYEEGAEIQASQDAVRAEMEKEYSKLREMLRKGEIAGNIYSPENMTPRLRELRAELEALFAKEREVIVKDELDHIYTREGASGMNAGTTPDQTVYFITVPSNKLELWFWLESDRLLNPVFREFYSERDVVREERRLRVESTPTGRLDEQFDALFWNASPYGWPVIGWPSDVESITRRQAEEFFGVYYAPNNITAALVGDFDPEEAVRLAERYFGRIPRGEIDPPEVVTQEIEQLAEKRLLGEADTNPRVTIRFQAVPFNHEDMFALDLLADILSGRTGRLYRSLVEEKQLAVGQPSAGMQSLRYEGFFQVGAEVKEGADPLQLEAGLMREIEKLQEDLVPERELQKVKNQAMANSFRRLQSNFFLLLQLLIYDSSDDWTYLNESPEKVQAVTAEEVREAARRYLKPEKKNVAVYLRREGAAPMDPALSGLPPEVRASVQQQITQIEESTDLESLQQALVQTQQMAGQAPEEFRPALEYVQRKIQERIAALEAEQSPETGPAPPQNQEQDR